jgi:hypothetical protein
MQALKMEIEKLNADAQNHIYGMLRRAHVQEQAVSENVVFMPLSRAPDEVIESIRSFVASQKAPLQRVQRNRDPHQSVAKEVKVQRPVRGQRERARKKPVYSRHQSKIRKRLREKLRVVKRSSTMQKRRVCGGSKASEEADPDEPTMHETEEFQWDCDGELEEAEPEEPHEAAEAENPVHDESVCRLPICTGSTLEERKEFYVPLMLENGVAL